MTSPKGFLAALLGLLGIPSCVSHNSINNEQATEYGCPYIAFKANGSVTDEEGNTISDVEISADEVVKTEDEAQHYALGSARTEEDGTYALNSERLDFHDTINVELVAQKEGYEPDTTNIQFTGKDRKSSNKRWCEGVFEKEVNFKLKKEQY